MAGKKERSEWGSGRGLKATGIDTIDGRRLVLGGGEGLKMTYGLDMIDALWMECRGAKGSLRWDGGEGDDRMGTRRGRAFGGGEQIQELGYILWNLDAYAL
ncbi:hypothetical protein ACLOJK_030730 [Asimina triloba]